MHVKSFPGFVLIALALALAGCRNYSSVSEKRATYHSVSPAGQLISQAQKMPSKEPLDRAGRYLDAASSAAAVLAKQPGDAQARADYNFATGRIFELVEQNGLEPWKTPLRCPGSERVWTLSMKTDARPERNPANFKLLPADRYDFKGSLVMERKLKPGLGAPLIAVSRVPDATKIDPFAQGKHVYYGVTGLIEFKGNTGTLAYADPLATETVKLDGRTYELAADFVAPIALALAELQPEKKEMKSFMKPDEMVSMTRLARLQPYDASKIPILCIHGLGDSQATWAPLIETLREDPVIRKNYQFWFFAYPTGFPYPLSASILRKDMDKINARYPDHKPIVVIGHSMGGMISRTLMTDSGMTLWNAVYDKPPGQMPFSDETRKVLTDALIFQHRPEISRVIFCSPSHRGADLATGFMGRIGSKLIGAPTNLLPENTKALDLAKPTSNGEQINKMPNSIDFLNPENRFVKTLDTIPLVKGIPYHSVLGDRGKGGNLSRTPPVSSDGIVPYWSSHLDGAQSELIVPSDHWTNRDPKGIAEVHRILLLHLGKARAE
jgi:hypothetical protein